MQKIIAIVGPTASGKTAISLAIAKKFGGEIISADSMQIYREMNIGTAKPSLEERAGIPHHLMGHISVEAVYNVAEYANEARLILDEMDARGCLPIICGGTGLYMDHLLSNTEFFEIPLDEKIRLTYQEMAHQRGNDAVYALLKERDPQLAAHLHPNDSKRVIRGLEVLEITGKRLSELQQESIRESPYEVLYIGLNYHDRQKLYERINLRVDLMIQNGLLDEIEILMKDYNLSATARAAIGYKELMDAIEAGEPITSAIELIKQKSRNYAKRQITWFGKNQKIHWFYRDEMSDEQMLENAFALVDAFLEKGAKREER